MGVAHSTPSCCFSTSPQLARAAAGLRRCGRRRRHGRPVSRRRSRRAAGEPLAYITGLREFWSLPLVVTPAVLVPGPKTIAAGAGTVLARLDLAPRLVADLGTGSGAIALALASGAARTGCSSAPTPHRRRWKWPQSIARGSESTNLALARRAPGATHCPRNPFDAIVSNPPYIAPAIPAADACRTTADALAARAEGYADLFRIAAGPRHSEVRRPAAAGARRGSRPAPSGTAELDIAVIACPPGPRRPRSSNLRQSGPDAQHR